MVLYQTSFKLRYIKPASYAHLLHNRSVIKRRGCYLIFVINFRNSMSHWYRSQFFVMVTYSIQPRGNRQWLSLISLIKNKAIIKTRLGHLLFIGRCCNIWLRFISLSSILPDTVGEIIEACNLIRAQDFTVLLCFKVVQWYLIHLSLTPFWWHPGNLDSPV